MEDITHWVIERVAKMPREHKFAIGDKLVEACLDVTCGLLEATYVRDTLALLIQAMSTSNDQRKSTGPSATQIGTSAGSIILDPWPTEAA
jgi:hypothetical protein